MIKIALAVVAAVGLTFAAHAQTVGPLCQDAHGSLLVCYSGHGGVSQVGPLCQDAHGSLLVCYSGHGGVSQVGPLCQEPMALCLSALSEVDP